MRNNSFWAKQSYKRKIFLFLLLMSIVPVLLIGTFSSLFTAKIVQKEVDHNHQIILGQMRYQIDGFLQNLEKASFQLASNIVIEKAVQTTPQRDLGQIFDAIDTILRQRNYSDTPYDVSLLFNGSRKVYSTRYGYINETDFPYYNQVKKIGAKYNSAVVIPPGSNPDQNELLVLRPVPTSFVNEPDGTLILQVDTGKLTALFDRVQLGADRRLLVIDDKGTIVMSQNHDELGTRLTSSSELYRYWSKPDENAGEIKLNGVKYNLSVEKSSFNNWSYIAMTPIKELTQKSQAIQTLTWSVVLALIVLWVLFSFVGSNRLYIPIQRLLSRFSGDARPEQTHKDGLQALDSLIQHMEKTNVRLKTELSEQLPYFKESVFQQLVRGEMSEQDIRMKTEQYGFPLVGSKFYVCLVEVDRYAAFQQTYQERDRSLILYALRKMIEEIVEEAFSCMTLTPLPGQVAVIIGVEKADNMMDERMAGLAELYRSKVGEYFHLTVTVSVSSAHNDYLGISLAYKEATELLGYRLLLGHNVVITQQSLGPAVRQSGQSLVKWQKRIVTSIAKGDIAEAGEHLSQMIEIVPKYVHNSTTVLGLFAYLLGELDMLLQEWGQGTADEFRGDWYKQLYAMTSLEDIRRWFEDTVFPAAIRSLEESDVPRRKKLVQQALLLIHEQFESDLSLQQVADHAGISPSQLSRFFKEETSSAFGDYLIQYRMEKAKEWLARTDMPIKDIAERLRYTSVTNFNRIFKQIAGTPPGQYRKNLRD